MTFNATFIPMESLKAAGFVEYQSPRPLRERRRKLFLAPKVADLLNGIGAIEAMFPSVEAERLLSTFEAGLMVTVSTAGKRSEVERLNYLDEVWSVGLRKPKPGWRLFGRFVAQDVLVIISAHDRYDLGRTSHYHSVAAAMIGDWDQLLPDVPPLRASSLTGYLSGVVRNVDEE